MTIAATSLAAALWDRYGRIDAIRRSSRKDAQQMLLMCFCIDNVLSRWNPRYLTDVLKGTLFLLGFLFCFVVLLFFCALTIGRLKTRCRANRHNLSLICVQLKLVAVHPEQNIISICLNTGLNRKELIGWGTFGQLSVIGVLVIVTILDGNHI